MDIEKGDFISTEGMQLKVGAQKCQSRAGTGTQDPSPGASVSLCRPRPSQAAASLAQVGKRVVVCFMTLNGLAFMPEDTLPWSVNRVEDMLYIW